MRPPRSLTAISERSVRESLPGAMNALKKQRRRRQRKWRAVMKWRQSPSSRPCPNCGGRLRNDLACTRPCNLYEGRRGIEGDDDLYLWRRKNEIRSARRHRCEVCGEPGLSLDVHHLRYSEWGNEPDEDLAVLCRACHDVIHDRLKAHGIYAPRHRRHRA